MSTIIVEKNVSVPMRDGVVLKADVYRSQTDEPLPAILIRTPYNKDLGLIQDFCLVSR